MATTDKLLIIEDNKDISYYLEQILSMVGIESSCAESLKESEFMLQQFLPLSIFVDNNLPDGLGFEYIAKIRGLHPFIKIIAMTANISLEAKKKAISNGANYYLEKPFTIDQVLNAVMDDKTIGNKV
jgi:two-component system, OmpR family, response regulator